MNHQSTKGAPLEEQLRSYLRVFPADQVDRFMFAMRAILVGAKVGTRDGAKRRSDIKRITAAAEALKAMTVETFGADFMRPLYDNAVVSIVDTGGLEQFQEDLRSGYGGDLSPLFLVWGNMMPHLNSFIRELNDEITRSKPRRRGRGRADPGRVLDQLGAIYAYIFGELPTSTEGSPFYNIAVKVLRQKNVQRPVQAAVASLRRASK